MDKSIIIIGGGLTGLALGCYGRMNGYKTSIFEMHKIAGGVCTGWKRKGYTIDGAVNWVMGTKPGSAYHKFWEEVGAAQQWKIHDHGYFAHIELEGDESFSFYTDVDRLEEYMIGISPEDKEIIEEFTGAIRSAAKMEMPVDKPTELMSLLDKARMVKMLPFGKLMKKWGTVSIEDFGRRFKNPLLRKVFMGDAFSDVSSLPMALIIMMFAWFSQKDAGYIIGGALALVSYIRQRYADLGGEIHFKSRVEKILVENDKAVGIRLTDGTEHRADWIVSAADGRTTIFDMLDGKYTDDTIRGYYDNPRLYSPLIYIGLGINRRFDDIPSSINGLSFPLDPPVTITGKERKRLGVLFYGHDPNLAPEGKTTLVVSIDTDYDYWEELYKDPERYKAEKEQIADTVVTLLDKRFPGLAGQVEVRDVATPMTWVRYTGNWRGSYEGWMMSLESLTMVMSKTLPGLDNFYMAGQWVNPGGGIPTAVMSGNHTIQMICKKDNKKFVTTRP